MFSLLLGSFTYFELRFAHCILLATSHLSFRRNLLTPCLLRPTCHVPLVISQKSTNALIGTAQMALVDFCEMLKQTKTTAVLLINKQCKNNLISQLSSPKTTNFSNTTISTKDKLVLKGENQYFNI